MMRRDLPAPHSLRHRRRGCARGFTLVELMVAMVAGMFVAIAVFTLAKHASAFATRQARIADATLQSVVGFERLKADISRAGFLTSPNVVKDPAMCRPSVDPLYPAGLARMASVFIEPVPTTQLSTESTLNGLSPSRIVLAGSYSSPDVFVARSISQTDPPVVFLSLTSLGMANIGYQPAMDAATLATVFPPNRALRILDDTGHVQFATISGVTGGANPSITLETEPNVQFRALNTTSKCGIRGLGNDFVNVVNFVRYDIRSLDDVAEAGLNAMYRGGPSYESTRRELVREELDVTGSPIAGTLELVAEYAVDLGFSLFVAPNDSSPLTRVSGAAVAQYAGDPSGLSAGDGPQLIRAVHAWLSVRSQEADRTSGLRLTTTAPGPNMLRISVNPTDATQPPFARVRTLQSTIPLNNQARATWRF
jgi:prepilin-type N-terminal cleavage/methylation domain-containing protein